MKYLLSLLMILGSFASAFAGEKHTTVTTVPFDFVVGNQTVPAGTYYISQISSSGSPVLWVGRKDGTAVGLISPLAVDAFSDHSVPKMVFERTGGTYRLTTLVADDRSFIFARPRLPATVPGETSTVTPILEP